eukprot:GHVN01104915.1.p1 GENE.GHVN01104915.1~~GHVN01104915.1.p1  ORF type:complete len:162 (+),score=16.12 GHVN01104915.1:173-658(+)
MVSFQGKILGRRWRKAQDGEPPYLAGQVYKILKRCGLRQESAKPASILFLCGAVVAAISWREMKMMYRANEDLVARGIQTDGFKCYEANRMYRQRCSFLEPEVEEGEAFCAQLHDIMTACHSDLRRYIVTEVPPAMQPAVTLVNRPPWLPDTPTVIRPVGE